MPVARGFLRREARIALESADFPLTCDFARASMKDWVHWLDFVVANWHGSAVVRGEVTHEPRGMNTEATPRQH